MYVQWSETSRRNTPQGSFGGSEIPYFPDLNCLFVHIPKNAGRSIEVALLGGVGSPDCGRRSFLNRAATALGSATASRFAKRYYIGTLDVALAAQHLTYVEMEMLGLLPESRDLISFCVVRNPYDRALSSVMHFCKAEWKDSDDDALRQAGFERDLEAWLNRPLTDHNLRAHRRSQVDFVRDCRGEIAVEHILRFESLGEDFFSLAARAGWKEADFGRVGDSGRRRAYRDFYTARSRALVEDCFGEDRTVFGYQY